MMLSIITINFNNAFGLRNTLESVFRQTICDFEYIVIDGNSTDGSKEVISQYNNEHILPFKWISESDNGIYQAMNKGIRLAQGEYVQFLNSGDLLVDSNVTSKMLARLLINNTEKIEILYGNMLKQMPKYKVCDRSFAGRIPTMLDFYTGSLNHSSAYIQRQLFDRYGFYDESLKIVSDWKWYLQVIGLNNIIPVYVDIDVSVFDMNGISNSNSKLDKSERKQVLEELLPLSVLSDYDRWSFAIYQLKRINNYKILSKSFYLLERTLFKFEKWFRNKGQLL